MRFVQNLIAATVATKTEDCKDSSDDSDAEEWENVDFKAGKMDLVQQTLQGMASRNADEGVQAMGRHARTIRLGRNLWESPPLESNVTHLTHKRFFVAGSFPPLKEVKSVVVLAKNIAEERPAPFQGKTVLPTTLTIIA